MYNYTTISEVDLGGGIDKQSAENRIPEGYCEDIENADPKSAGYITKRTGYQGYAGGLPIRVERISYSTAVTDNISLHLDTSITVPVGQSQPLVVLGQTSSTGNPNNYGDFPNTGEVIKYYSGFVSEIRRTFFTGSNTLSIPASEHNINTANLFIQCAKSNSTILNDNEHFFVDSITINEGTYEVQINYTNLSPSFDGFVFIKDVTTVSRQTFTQSDVVATGLQTFTILEANHDFEDKNILPQFYSVAGGIRTSIMVEKVEINPTTRDVTVTLNNLTISAVTVVSFLIQADSVNFKTGAAAPSSVATVTLPMNTEAFAYFACYLEQTPGGTLEQVIPDSIVYNSTTDLTTVTFYNYSPSGATFEIYYTPVTIATNILKITGTVIASAFDDTSPQLTLYGIPHEGIYGVKTKREGWVNHIDSYKSQGDNRLVAGLGGNIFAAYQAAESSITGTTLGTEYLMGSLYPRLQSRLDSDTIIGPAFYATGETPDRTRGYITGDAGGSNFFTVDSIEYNTGTGYVDYYLDVPGLVINGTLSTIISSTANLEDYFTAQQCGYRHFNGTFKIKGVANPAAEVLVISVENDNIDTVDFNEVNVGGEGGVFSDRLTMLTSSPYIMNDTITCGLFPSTVDITVASAYGLSVVINGVTEVVSLPSGIRMLGQRTSSVIPLRDITNTASVVNFVRGDMITYTGIDRKLRVKSINQLPDVNLTINGDVLTNTATITLGSYDTNYLFIGKKILITGSTAYDGAHEITNIISETEFQIASESGVDESAVMVGKTIEVDEDFEFTDSTDNSIIVAVDSRWIPVEAPIDSFTATPKTQVYHFEQNEYDNQPTIRSTMVSDNLYLTNGSDEVFKYDGNNIYRAGLFRWQANLFATVDTTNATIVVDNPTVATAAASSANIFSIAPADELKFAVGDIIQHSLDAKYYTIENIKGDSADTPTVIYISVDRNIANLGAVGNLTRVSSYNYYFRLNAIDANDNLLASAVTGSNDSVIRLSVNSSVRFRLISPPIMDIYDYNRLEVQIYRTKKNQTAPFYKLTTLPVSFNKGDIYIDYTDTSSDEDFPPLPDDGIMTAIKGAELGTAITQPLQAKYITSAGNRLVLGNLTDFPQLDMRIVKKSPVLNAAVFYANANRTWFFRKSNTDTGTTADMVNRASYQFRHTFSAGVYKTITGVSAVTGVSFTLTVGAAHGFVAGDWVYCFHATPGTLLNLRYAGWFQINSVGATDITIKFNNADSTDLANFPNRALYASNRTFVPVPIDLDYNYQQYNGNRSPLEAYEFIAVKRLAEAINASMRAVDLTLTSPDMQEFVPWMTAHAGNEYSAGQLIIQQPKIFPTTLELVVPSLSGDFEVYGNGVKRSGNASIGAVTKVFPSRIIASYPNFAEIFDNPTSQSPETESDSAIDVNSSDGQEITALISFFGDSAFGSAQQSGTVVVFKTNSIYLVDLAAKDQGQNPVQKLETRGQGCTAPHSVAVTKDGIIFANETGMYRLNRNLTVDYIGRKYDRKYAENLNKDMLSIATGTHDAIANSYKLSYPINDDIENSEVAVYNHTREYEGKGEGSWTTYTNHPVTGWANLFDDSYFASTNGRVFSIRRLGEISDYRDDSEAIDMSIITRAMDMGDSGIRKIVQGIVTHYRVITDTSATVLQTAMDLKTQFQDTDSFVITKTNNSDGLGASDENKLISIMSTVNNKIGTYIQLRYQNSGIDEPVEIVGIDYRVSAKTDKGILQAKTTRR